MNSRLSPSSALASSMDTVTDDASSSSVMVPVASSLPSTGSPSNTTPSGRSGSVSRSTAVRVSVSSATASSIVVTVIVPEVSPAAMVILPCWSLW